MSVESAQDDDQPFRSFYELPIWVEWKELPDGSKMPYKPGSNYKTIAYVNKPSTWGLIADRNGDDIGIFLGNGLCGMDIDGCRDPVTEIIDDWAKKWILLFNSYTEISPSGTGVKIFFIASNPSLLKGIKCSMPGEPKSKLSGGTKPPGIELYSHSRYFTVTCNQLQDTPCEIRTCNNAWREVIEFVTSRTGSKKEYAGRDDAIFKHGCNARAAGHDDATVERVMREKNTWDSDLHPNFQTEGPLEERVFLQKLRQVLRYNAGHPGPNGELEKMNKEYTVLESEGNKFRIMSWGPSAIDPDCREYSLQTKKDFEDGVIFPRVEFENDKGDVKPTALGKWWLANPGRRQFKKMVFEPDGPPEISGCLNIWNGWGVVPSPGNWSLMRDHIQEVLVAGDAGHADYVIRWLAWAVQNPAEPSKTALIFQGGQQTGKGIFARTILKFFGTHGVHISSSDHLTGRFNNLLHQCCLLFADEAFYAGDKRGIRKLKAFITEPTITIERKGIDPITVRNCLHIIMASNEEWVVEMDKDDRRFVPFRISNHRVDDHAYFDLMADQLRNGGYAGMLHDLREMPLGNWRPNDDPPVTKAKEEQREYSDSGANWRDLIERAIEEALNRFDEPVTGWKMLCDDMRNIISNDERTWRNGSNSSLLSQVTKSLGYKKDKVRYGQSINPRYCYVWGENPRAILEVTRDKDGVFIRVSPWDKELNPKGQNNARY